MLWGWALVLLVRQEVLLVVVPRPGRTLDPAALHRRLEGELPRYMQPAYLLVVESEAMPRTPTNKIRKVAVLETFDLGDAWRSPRMRRAPSRTAG